MRKAKVGRPTSASAGALFIQLQKGPRHMADIPQPRFRFLTARPGGPAEFEPRELDLPVPLSNPARQEVVGAGFTYGTYLSAMQRFLLGNIERLTAVTADLGCTGPIESVDVVSEKHGSDYHPARIVVHTPGGLRSFVLNVAVTPRGRERLQRDFELLRRLRRKSRSDFLPEAHFCGEQAASDDPRESLRMLMFLGKWFEGYHEFHPSLDEHTGAAPLLLWDLEEGYHSLSPTEESEVFRQAAFILTTLYDPETFEEVFPWHHAAGDFVVSRSGGNVDVKLITVRQYAPRAVFHETSPQNRLLALALFFVGLSLRMRLDRLDGVGTLVWAGDRCLDATIRGFLDGLKGKALSNVRDEHLAGGFREMLKAMSVEELAEFFQVVVDSYDGDSPDAPLIADNLVHHIMQIYARLQDFGEPRSGGSP